MGLEHVWPTIPVFYAGEDRMMVKLMAVVEKLQQELFDVEKSRKEAEACAPFCSPTTDHRCLIDTDERRSM